jgi:molybdate transport system substrate-binding protein
MKPLTLICCLWLIALSCVPSPAAAQAPVTLTVFAAASLTNALTEAGAAFTAATGVRVVYSFGASSELAAQLAQGAPCDVFASANLRQMQVANEAGRLGAPPVTFARNRLVVIVPADTPAQIAGLHDLANDGVRLVLAAPSVPIREYTDVMLARMAFAPAFGPRYRAAVLANLVSEETNVRQSVAKVVLGEADASIVYISDVTPNIADQVQMLTIPDAFNTTAQYPIARTNDTPHAEAAQAYIAFLLSDEGQAIVTRWNFIEAP